MNYPFDIIHSCLASASFDMLSFISNQEVI